MAPMKNLLIQQLLQRASEYTASKLMLCTVCDNGSTMVSLSYSSGVEVLCNEASLYALLFILSS